MKNAKKIILGNSKFLVVDLTKQLSLNSEVFPGDPKLKREILSKIKKTGCEHYTHLMSDHIFQPHADAPKHQNLSMQRYGIESLNFKYFFNKTFLIDLSNSLDSEEHSGIKYLCQVRKQHLLLFKEKLSEKSAVLIRTGYDLWLEKNFPHNLGLLPYLNKDASKYLASFKNLKVIGTDSITVDPIEKHDSHQLLKDKFIIESMVNLHSIPLEYRLDFDLQTSPFVIVGATGVPVIAYAYIDLNK